MGSPPASKSGSLKPPPSPCPPSPSSSVEGSWSPSEWSSQGSGGGRGAAASESNWVEVERDRIPIAAAPTWTCFVCLQDFPAEQLPVGRSSSGGSGGSSAQAPGRKLTCRSCSSFKTCWQCHLKCECNHTAGEGEGVGHAGHGHDGMAENACRLCDGRRIRGFDLTTLHSHSPPHDGDDGNDGDDDDDKDDASKRSDGRRRHIGGSSRSSSSSDGGDGGGGRRGRSRSRSEDGFYVLPPPTSRGLAAVAPPCQDSRADDGSSTQHDGCDESGSGNGSAGSSSASVFPSLFSTRKALGGMQPCGGCGKDVTYFESVMGPRAKRFHAPCLRCGECGRAMESSSTFELDYDGLMRFCCRDCAMDRSIVVVEGDKT